jgi:hypothetical protein
MGRKLPGRNYQVDLSLAVDMSRRNPARSREHNNMRGLREVCAKFGNNGIDFCYAI